jgi:hypothetical protein
MTADSALARVPPGIDDARRLPLYVLAFPGEISGLQATSHSHPAADAQCSIAETIPGILTIKDC